MLLTALSLTAASGGCREGEKVANDVVSLMMTAAPNDVASLMF